MRGKWTLYTDEGGRMVEGLGWAEQPQYGQWADLQGGGGDVCFRITYGLRQTKNGHKSNLKNHGEMMTGRQTEHCRIKKKR